jgi:membrane-associated phospholipid phosphatase
METQADAHGLATARRLRVVSVVAVSVLVAAYLLLVLTPIGQSWDDAALVGRLRERAADRAEVGRFLRSIDTVTLLLMVVVVVAVGLVRRRARLALLAGGAFVAAVVSAELLKAVLPRPAYGTELAILASKDYDTYPSGHATIATGFVLAVVLVAGNRWRPWVGLLGMVWAGSIATGVVAAGWHRPSDAIGGVALATAWLSLAAAWLSRERGVVAEPGRLARALPALGTAFGLLVVVTAVVLALTGRQDRMPADVAWWAFPIGQIAIDLAVITAVGSVSWLLRDLRFGDPAPSTAAPAAQVADHGA